MKINLRDYYPHYREDHVVEVPDEVAAILKEYARMEESYQRRVRRNRAYYSLDYEGHMERDGVSPEKSPHDALEEKQMTEALYKGLSALSEKQRQRITAHYLMGMSVAEIARADGCSYMSVKESIERGLRSLGKFFVDF